MLDNLTQVGSKASLFNKIWYQEDQVLSPSISNFLALYPFEKVHVDIEEHVIFLSCYDHSITISDFLR